MSTLFRRLSALLVPALLFPAATLLPVAAAGCGGPEAGVVDTPDEDARTPAEMEAYNEETARQMQQ